MERIKSLRDIPLHFFKDDSIEEFQNIIKELFLGDDRDVTKRYLKLFILFIERIGAIY